MLSDAEVREVYDELTGNDIELMNLDEAQAMFNKVKNKLDELSGVEPTSPRFYGLIRSLEAEAEDLKNRIKTLASAKN
ncbi:hypothetical protein [Leptolyngbya sp. FACHB-261]|uniref:hypothetical protein n=1 Tax=Leptolyngbya sp. FACHB-261 TaxID=2692806 RepID=UPI001684F324|nr:hypothetical protein [Leptolyngbya sp. FACHB-261]MBD2102224.1 hypothetical protein [Leptolyngbya sp. FACHB-261]